MAENFKGSKSRAGPWLNKNELSTVFNLIYATPADHASKSQACEILKMWIFRRQQLTPASILSTLAILETQIRDDEKSPFTTVELRALYSNAFTRFLNYMSSIMQYKSFKSMYQTAKELGLESFLVDLRHLCSHSHVLPNLNVFRRCADYCMNWLKQFYWQRELGSIRDVTIHEVRLENVVTFEESIENLLIVYDIATDAIWNRKWKTIADMDSKYFPIRNIEIVNDFSFKCKQTKFSVIATAAINEMTKVVHEHSSIRSNEKLYCDLVFRCKFLIKSSAEIAKITFTSDNMLFEQKHSAFIQLHQNLFRSLAICGFIDDCLDLLLCEICENDHESDERRLAASFWSYQIVIGFFIFQEFKNLCKVRKEKNPNFNIDLAVINTEAMTNDICNIYKQLGVNCKGVLLVGDTIRRPWFISLSRQYIHDRLSNINEYSAKTIEKCLNLIDPPYNRVQRAEILTLIQTYLGKKFKADEKKFNFTNSYFTLEDLYWKIGEVKKQKTHLISLANNNCYDNCQKKYGIWMEDSSNRNWQKIPIGRQM